MKKPIDGNLQWVTPDGKPTLYFLEVMQSLNKHCFNQPVSATDAPANGETPLYDATAGVWTFGAN